jgi:hypothetical protein
MVFRDFTLFIQAMLGKQSWLFCQAKFPLCSGFKRPLVPRLWISIGRKTESIVFHLAVHSFCLWSSPTWDQVGSGTLESIKIKDDNFGFQVSRLAYLPLWRNYWVMWKLVSCWKISKFMGYGYCLILFLWRYGQSYRTNSYKLLCGGGGGIFWPGHMTSLASIRSSHQLAPTESFFSKRSAKN